MPVPNVLVNIGEDAQVVLRAQVLAPGLEQVQVILQRPLFQRPGLGGGGGVHLGGGPVLHVDGVHIVNELHHFLGLQKVGEPPAEGGGEVELPVGEGPRPAKAAHGAAHLALDAAVHLAGHDGAAAMIDVRPLLHHQHLRPGAFPAQLIGGEDARLPGS